MLHTYFIEPPNWPPNSLNQNPMECSYSGRSLASGTSSEDQSHWPSEISSEQLLGDDHPRTDQRCYWSVVNMIADDRSLSGCRLHTEPRVLYICDISLLTLYFCQALPLEIWWYWCFWSIIIINIIIKTICNAHKVNGRWFHLPAGFELDRNAPERRSGSFFKPERRSGSFFFENSERKSDGCCCVHTSVLPSVAVLKLRLEPLHYSLH